MTPETLQFLNKRNGLLATVNSDSPESYLHSNALGISNLEHATMPVRIVVITPPTFLPHAVVVGYHVRFRFG